MRGLLREQRNDASPSLRVALHTPAHRARRCVAATIRRRGA